MDNQYSDVSPYTIYEASNKSKNHIHKT